MLISRNYITIEDVPIASSSAIVAFRSLHPGYYSLCSYHRLITLITPDILC
jgi:hypothetical protein